jgi:hypothetical protein
VSDFLADPEQADVISKLTRSGAARTEVFIAATLDGAPWSVVSYLTGDVTVVPTAAPQLPPPVTGVWICPTHGTKSVYWDGSTAHRDRSARSGRMRYGQPLHH